MFDPKGLIKKVNLTFTSKFFYLLVWHRLSPTSADNSLTWDRAVLVAAMVAGLVIDFAKLMMVVIHERAFRTSTTFSICVSIFHLCRDVGVTIWHCNTLYTMGGTVDIGLISD